MPFIFGLDAFLITDEGLGIFTTVAMSLVSYLLSSRYNVICGRLSKLIYF